MDKRARNLIIDAVIIALSVVAAIFLGKSGMVEGFLAATKERELLSSFFAGIFFVSVFTAAPATVIFAELADVNSIFLIAVCGGAGALLGDLVIFRFIRNRLAADFSFFFNKKAAGDSAPRSKIVRRLLIIVGAIVVASPLPDELGLTMMGISRIKMGYFIPLSFLLNSAGILIICLIGRAII